MQTDKDSYIEQETQKIVTFWLSVGLIAGAGVFILLSLLDYLVTPENFVRFLYYRIGAAFLLIISAPALMLSRKASSNSVWKIQPRFY